jgi:hypothetical protein
LLAKRRRFQQPQRDGARALLASRADHAEVATVERQQQVVAVRSGVRAAAP